MLVKKQQLFGSFSYLYLHSCFLYLITCFFFSLFPAFLTFEACSLLLLKETRRSLIAWRLLAGAGGGLFL